MPRISLAFLTFCSLLIACSQPESSSGGSWPADIGGDGQGGVQLDVSGSLDGGSGIDGGKDGGLLQDAGVPDSLLSDSTGTDSALSDAVQSDTAKPDIFSSDTAGPDTAYPDTAYPDTGNPVQCQQNAQCPGQGACKVGECAAGQCVLTPVWGCCESGACCDAATHQPKAAGSACDAAPLQTEYDCQGQNVVMRTLQPGCDGITASGCSGETGAAVWTPWQSLQTCASGSSCLLVSKTKKPQCNSGPPPECVEDAGCDTGNPCVLAKCVGYKCQTPQTLAGAICSSVPSASQYQCSGTGLGSDIQVRKGYKTCTAAAACTADTLVWDVWLPYKSCNYNQVCAIADPAQPGTCEKGPDCTPGTACCDAQGKYAAQGTACGTWVVDTQYQCTGGQGATWTGGTIQKREAVGGCSGTSTYCSSLYPAWGTWSDVQTCEATQDCKPSWSDAYSPTCTFPCTPGATCCQKDGTFAPAKTACGYGVMDSEEKCSGPEKGGQILQRKADCGCKGTSTSCSCSSADYAWSDWAVTKTCTATQVCEVSFGYAQCVSAFKCTPGSTCCDADGQYLPVTSPCGTSTADTEWACEGTGLGAKVLKRTAHYGCSGTSTSCSYSSANYVWSDWAATKTCPASQYCKLYADYLEPSCSTSP